MRPISEELYQNPSPEFLRRLRERQAAVEISPSPGLRLAQSYFRAHMKGTQPQTFARQVVAEALVHAGHRLHEESQGKLALTLFDAFRSIETQLDLFAQMQAEVWRRNPSLSPEEAWKETRRFVSHPDDKSKYQVMPHNSGGAIDIGIVDTASGEVLDFGTPYDDPSDASRTDYFEMAGQNPVARDHRRRLFGLMIDEGFTNYENEWWHYDLGNGIWSRKLKLDPVFDSLEPKVQALLGS